MALARSRWASGTSIATDALNAGELAVEISEVTNARA
jgi:hypothetical protein